MSYLSGLDEEQWRILDRRISSRNAGGYQGPPGTGKSWLMAHEALLSLDLDQWPVVVGAFGNQTVDNVIRYARALHLIAGGTEHTFRALACRIGYTPAISDDVLPIHSNEISRMREARLIFTTLYSTHHIEEIARDISVQRIIIDETAQARPEQGFQVLQSVTPGLNQSIPVTVVGDDMQARPITSSGMETGILARLKRTRPSEISMLTMSYRLPEPNVDMTSQIFYEGQLDSPPEVRARRLELQRLPTGLMRQIIDPDERLTFADIRGGETWGWGYQNELQARLACRIVRSLHECGIETANSDRLLLLSPQKGQVIETMNAISGFGLSSQVLTVTKSIGLEADIVITQLVRSNSRGYLGMGGLREILNVATSRSRRKLIIVGDWSTFADGYAWHESTGLFPSRSRSMAQFIEHRGAVIEVPVSAV